MIYLVSVASQNSGRVEHHILKLDRKAKRTQSTEVDRHILARSKSPPEFTRSHIPETFFDRIETDEAAGYSIPSKI